MNGVAPFVANFVGPEDHGSCETELFICRTSVLDSPSGTAGAPGEQVNRNSLPLLTEIQPRAAAVRDVGQPVV